MYKAAFYDRDAGLSAVPRYTARYTKDDYSEVGAPYIPAIRDSDGTVLWRGEPCGVTYKDSDVAAAQALAVLDATCPKYAEVATRRQTLVSAFEAIAYDDLEPSEQRSARYKAHQAELSKLDAEMMGLYWDVDAVFPPSLSQVPPGEMYSLDVRVYRRGSCVDQGSNSSRRCVNLGDAKEKLIPSARALLGAYDEVKFSIRLKGEVVFTGEVSKPQREAPFDRRRVIWNHDHFKRG